MEPLRRGVAALGRALLVLQPWDAPLPLARQLCLWEIFCCLDGGAGVHVVLSAAQQAALADALVRPCKGGPRAPSALC